MILPAFEIMEYGQGSFLPLKDKKELRGRLFDSFRRLGALQELVDDEEVTEIMVNGADHVFVEKKRTYGAVGQSL